MLSKDRCRIDKNINEAMIFEEKNKHNFEKFLKFTKKSNHFIALAIFLILEHHAETQKIPFA